MTDLVFSSQSIGPGAICLRWGDDPLDYWVVAEEDVEEAKRLVVAGALETQDGSTIPATVALCKSWLSSEPRGPA